MTNSMVHIHQGRDTYHNSTIRDKQDMFYNKRLPTQFAKLHMTPYSINRVGINYAFNVARTK